jgi:hypothetical protein
MQWACVLFSLLLWSHASAFVLVHVVPRRPGEGQRVIVSLSKEDSNSDGSPMRSSRKTGRRAGGRSRSKRPSKAIKKTQELPGWAKMVALPIASLWLLFQLLFGGGSSPNYYYYQSSVYETSVYTNGRVDTSRKESAQSNVPGLLDNNQSQPRRIPGSSDGRLNYESRADEEFDELLDQEIDSLMGFQRRLMDEFW